MTFEEASTIHEDKFLTFIDIELKRSSRPDMHAFLLLNDLVPGEDDIVSSAEHDQIWLGVELADLNEVATEDQMVELIRCGVMYDEETDSLSMFV